MKTHQLNSNLLIIATMLLILISGNSCKPSANNPFSKDVWTAIDSDDALAIRGIRDPKKVFNQVGFLNRKSPLQYALEKRKKYAFRALLENGADPDYFLPSKQTVTFECALLNDSYWLSEVLANGADPNLWTKTHRNNIGTPLKATYGYHESAKNPECAKLLIDAGVRVNERIDVTEYPLSLFAMKSGWKVVHYLLEKGADPHIGPEANVFFTHLQNPSDYLSKDPDFQAVQAKLVEMNLDVAKAKWNGKTWDIPNLRPPESRPL